MAAINAVMIYCGAEEVTSYRRGRQGRPVENDVSTVVKVEEPVQFWPNIALSQAIRIDKRPAICFLYFGNPKLPTRDRVFCVFISWLPEQALSREVCQEAETWRND
jgi:hypothetical protein